MLVEFKARFDEESNIAWARALADAGGHVAYGVLGLKTHAKLCLVVRREQDRLQYYVPMGTCEEWLHPCSGPRRKFAFAPEKPLL